MIPRDDAPEGSAFLLWTLQDKASRYFISASEFAAESVKLSQTMDVYIGAALRKPGLASHERGTVEQCVGLLGLFADIDIAAPGSGHAGGKKYPPTERDARSLIDAIGLDPSLVIHSGGGLQAWWLFREPWMFASDAERHVAAALCRNWVQTIGAVAKVKGWVVDPVGDLPRVMRVVGTLNRKQAEPRPVRVIADNGAMYNPDSFDQFMVAPEYCGSKPAGMVEVAAVTLQSGRGLPLRASELLANDSQFKRTWQFNRTDFDSPSDASAYDLSLAGIGVVHGWSDQEIADTMGAWRESNATTIAARTGKTPDEIIAKGRRRDYVTRTIGVARAGKQAERAIQEIAASPEIRDKRLLTDDKRKQYIDSLSAIFKRRVIKWIRHGKEQAVYTLVLGDPQIEVRIGDAMAAMTYQRFAARLFAYDVILEIHRKQWPDVLKALTAVVEEIQSPTDTPAERLLDWLKSYLGVVRVFGASEWHKSFPQNMPFSRDGRLWVHSGNMREFTIRQQIVVRDGEWFDDLRAAGFAPKTVTHSTWGTSRTYWSVPMDDLPADWPTITKHGRQPETPYDGSGSTAAPGGMSDQPKGEARASVAINESGGQPGATGKTTDDIPI